MYLFRSTNQVASVNTLPTTNTATKHNRTSRNLEDIELGTETCFPAECLPPTIPTVDKGYRIPSRHGINIRIKQWRALDGNFRFLFDGRLMFGSGTTFWWMFMTCHIISSLICFLIFEIKPICAWSSFYDWSIPIVTILSGIASISYVFLTVFTEPGCIPKDSHEQRLQNLIQYHFEKEPGAKNVQKVMIYNGKEQICTFCYKCCQFKPKRATHCDLCAFCIDRRVHHCGVFGVCLGRRNYRFFYGFLLFLNLLFMTILVISITNLVKHSKEVGFLSALKLSPTSFVLGIGLICPPLGIIQLFIVFLQHSILIPVDRTFSDLETKKYFDSFKGKTFLGTLKWMALNIYDLLLIPAPASLLTPRNYVEVRATRRTIVPKKKRTGFNFWICGLNTEASKSLASKKGNADTKASKSLVEGFIVNPLIDQTVPKQRGVYTLPSFCSKQFPSTTTQDLQGQQHYQSRFQTMRAQLYNASNSRYINPQPGQEFAEPRGSP